MKRQLRSLCLAAASTAFLVGATGCQTEEPVDKDNQAAQFLPFKMPPKTELRASKKKVFAHYFYPFPISIDNKPPAADYYAKGYMAPSGESNKHLAYGGYLRQRPIPREPLLEENWPLADMMKEVKMASDIGLDGFCIDILGTDKNGRCKKLETLLDAAQKADPSFKIMLMPDMAAEFKTKPENFVKVFEAVKDHPSVYRTEDGRVVVSPWCPAKGTAKWWKEFIDAMAAKGVKICLVPVFQAWWNYTEEFGPISEGFSDWGCGTNTEEVTDGRKRSPQHCHKLGKLWMSPVRPQDFRPKSQVAWESDNSELFRNMWDTAISGDSEWVQLVTWSDYSEASEIMPSTGTQYSFYDLSAYYVSWFKEGEPPKIVKDELVYFYRSQLLGLLPEKQTSPLFKIVGKPSERIELLAFMKEPGTLEIEIGGKLSRQDFPAGLNSFRVPSALGKPVFRLVRDGQPVVELTGKWEIVGKADYQDLLYRGGSSLRELPQEK